MYVYFTSTLVMCSSLVMLSPVSAKSLDRCEKYNGSICDKTDYDEPKKSILVYVNKGSTQKEKERELGKLLKIAKRHPYVDCVDLIKYVLCSQFFPVCTGGNDRPDKIFKICRKDCEAAKNTLCYSEMRHVQKLSSRLSGFDCKTLPRNSAEKEGCLDLNIKSNDSTVYESCRKVNRGKGFYFEKVNIMEDTDIQNIYSPLNIKLEGRLTKSTYTVRNKVCVTQKKLLRNVIIDFDSRNVLLLPNVIVENMDSRLIQGYCYDYGKSKSIYKRLIAPLGEMKLYSPGKYLRLSNVKFTVENNKRITVVKARGTHNLCGINFDYKIFPETRNIAVMHATSRQPVSMKVIEMAHPLNEFPLPSVGLIERILRDKFKLMTSLILNKPIWSIVWSNGNRISAFKGIGSVELNTDLLKDVEIELFIDASIKFWTLCMNFQMDIFQLADLIGFAFPLFTRIPFLKKGWEEEVKIHKVEMILSTDHVDVPATKYLSRKYILAKYFLEGKLHHGMTLKFKGRIQKSNGKRSSLPSFLPAKVEFETTLDMRDNNLIKFEFISTGDHFYGDCSTRSLLQQDWSELKELFHKAKAESKNPESKVLIQKSKCTYCCDSNLATLLSINGKLYQEKVESKYAEYGVPPTIYNYLDLDAYVSQRDEIQNYRLKKYSL